MFMIIASLQFCIILSLINYIRDYIFTVIIVLSICGGGGGKLWQQFEKRPKRNDNGEWRRLHSEELYRLYRSLNVVGVSKSTRLRWQTI